MALSEKDKMALLSFAYQLDHNVVWKYTKEGLGFWTDLYDILEDHLGYVHKQEELYRGPISGAISNEERHGLYKFTDEGRVEDHNLHILGAHLGGMLSSEAWETVPALEDLYVYLISKPRLR